ncbi:hypothetical protein ABT096_29505 [Streptomyces sp. NPDC002561]|uniref:hypothetical protein n=1 Tax=Streptomyces sp. NPDC002561 TaxID=3154418 RepID=UPI00332D27AC
MTASRNPVPAPHDIAYDEWKTDNARGRRYCPEHPQQQMISLGIRDVCPMEHGRDYYPRAGG